MKTSSSELSEISMFVSKRDLIYEPLPSIQKVPGHEVELARGKIVILHNRHFSFKDT